MQRRSGRFEIRRPKTYGFSMGFMNCLLVFMVLKSCFICFGVALIGNILKKMVLRVFARKKRRWVFLV